MANCTLAYLSCGKYHAARYIISSKCCVWLSQVSYRWLIILNAVEFTIHLSPERYIYFYQGMFVLRNCK